MPDKIAYEIHIRDVLDDKWAPYFAPLIMISSPDETILTGLIHDQAELFGILLKIRDLGLSLKSLASADQK